MGIEPSKVPKTDFNEIDFPLTEFTLKGSSGFKEEETQNGHKPARHQRGPGSRRRERDCETSSVFSIKVKIRPLF